MCGNLTKDYPNEKNKAYLFKACDSKNVSRSHVFWQSLQGRRRKGKALEWREGFRCALLGGHWLEEAGAGQTSSEASYLMGWGYTLGFLGLVVSWKQRQKWGKLWVINQALAIWELKGPRVIVGHPEQVARHGGLTSHVCLIDSRLASGAGHCRQRIGCCILWIRVIYIFLHIWPLSICIFCLSLKQINNNKSNDVNNSYLILGILLSDFRDWNGDECTT